MTSMIFKFAMMGILAFASVAPSSASARKSKLKIVSGVSIENRFRKPGETRITNVGGKTVRVRRVAKRIRHREAPLEIVVQAHRREPVMQTQESMQADLRSSLPTIRRSTKNNLSIEMLGRGGLYSLDYDRELGRSVNMGFGFSYVSVRMNADEYAAMNATLITVPIYGNFYMNSDPRHRFMGTGGVTIISAKAEAAFGVQLQPEAKEMAMTFVSDLDLSANAQVILPMPVGGAGYEYKSSGGLLARAALYVVYVGSIQPWAGVALGGHF